MGIRRACNWYKWLWLSPLLTLPTLYILYNAGFGYELVCSGRGACNWWAVGRLNISVGVLASALWHLVLLVPARDREHPFVHWHGRQALLLAGVRTAVPLVFGLAFGVQFATLLFIPVTLAIWFVGTRWGQRQAARGECSLMRRCGHGGLLDSLRSADRQMQMQAMEPDALVEIIRQGGDPELRRAALEQADRLGMVESV